MQGIRPYRIARSLSRNVESYYEMCWVFCFLWCSVRLFVFPKTSLSLGIPSTSLCTTFLCFSLQF